MTDFQIDNSFWTSSFKKLIAATEDDKKLRAVHKILVRALGGQDEQQMKRTPIIRMSDLAKKMVSITGETPNTPKCKKHVQITTPTKEPKSPFSTPPPKITTPKRIKRVQITTPKKVPKPHQVDNAHNLHLLKTKIYEINQIKTPEIKSTHAQNDIIKSIPHRLPKTLKESQDFLNEIVKTEEPVVFRRERVYKSLTPKCKAQKTLDNLFLYENGEQISPIPNKFTRNNIFRRSENDKFIVNLYESKTNKWSQSSPKPNLNHSIIRMSNKLFIKDNVSPCANIVTEMSHANMTPDKVLERSLIRKQNRIVSPVVLDVFSKMDDTEIQDILNEIEITDQLAETQIKESSTYLVPKKLNFDAIENNQSRVISTIPLDKVQENIDKLFQDTNNNDEYILENDTFFKLKLEADIQSKVMKQASKALEICRNSKKCINKNGQIEAEKILLVASYKHEAIMKKIRESNCENKPQKLTNNLGTVKLSNIKMPLKKIIENKLTEHFICIVSNSDRVLSTKVVQKTDSMFIQFNEEFVFENVDSNFDIKLNVYSLKMADENTDSRYRLNKKVSTLCRSSRKLLYKDIQTQTLVESNILTSCFVLRGSLTLKVDNIMDQTEWTFDKLSKETSLTGTINIATHIKDIKINQRQSGFLNVGIENQGCISWNRRWCVLDGDSLKFWNYPNEEDVIEPISVLDLKTCIKEIEIASRSVCPRPKSILMETWKYPGHLYLNADTIGDMHTWRKHLNSVFNTLKSWKMLEAKS